MGAIHTLLVTFQPQELNPILRRVRPHHRSWSGGRAWVWERRGNRVTALLTGMGAAAAHKLTQQATSALAPRQILIAGFGGALTSLPPPGGILLASHCYRLEPDRDLGMQQFHPLLPSLHELATHLTRAGLPTSTGVTVSTPRIWPKAAVLSQVAHLPRPVVDLETAAVAAAAGSTPCLAIRAITDAGGEEIAPFLAELINRHQSVPLSRLLLALAAQPRRFPYIVHLWRRSRLAGKNLGRAVHLTLEYLSDRSDIP